MIAAAAASTPGAASIEARAAFDEIRYANCWEDADVLARGLEVTPGDRIASIASAGDNALALLARGATVVAIDLSLAQLAAVEIRVAAFRELDREAVLAFLGFTPSSERTLTFRQLRPHLSPSARRFWSDRLPAIESGLIHAGKFERYFRLFRTRVLPLVHRQRAVRQLLRERTAAERELYYESRWNNRRWRLMFRLFFSRLVMGRFGRDPEFFRYVEGAVGTRILERTRHALTAVPTHDNPYLEYILTGAFTRALPPYLRPEFDAPIRAGLDRLSLIHAPIDRGVATAARADGGFDGFNLSDLFEYLDPELFETVYGRLLDHARPGARLAYWNMLVPRACPAVYRDRVTPDPAFGASLLAEDRAFFYSAFHVDRVKRP